VKVNCASHTQLISVKPGRNLLRHSSGTLRFVAGKGILYWCTGMTATKLEKDLCEHSCGQTPLDPARKNAVHS
jgi:hypothetical protein